MQVCDQLSGIDSAGEDQSMLQNRETALATIKRQFPHLNPALKRIAAYIMEEPDRVKLQKIGQLASACQVSEASVTRFVKAIEFNSFTEFKIAIAAIPTGGTSHFEKEDQFFYNDLVESDSVEDVVTKITLKNIQSLKDTQSLISQKEIERAVSAIQKADMIAIYCAGYSTVAAESFKFRFYRMGKPSLVYNDPIQQAVSASMLNDRSMAIGISSSGRTKYVVDAIKVAKSSGATTMCVTDSSDSPLVQHSDISFFTFSKHSDFLQDSMLSRMSQMLIADILFACFALKDYKRSIENAEKTGKAIERVSKSIVYK
jgi:RpiR family transcriptional regulator, carbohydrate utilization regulator